MLRLLLLAFALLPFTVHAQDRPLRDMEPARPNETDTPSTIDAGHVQFEIGALDISRERERGEDAREWSVGEIAMRVGVLDNLELAVTFQPHIGQSERIGQARQSATGFGDVIVGAKVNLWGNEGDTATALTIRPQLTLPTAAGDLGAGQAEASIALPFTATLPAGFGLSLQPTLSRQAAQDNDGTVTGYRAAAALDHDVGAANLFAEYVWEDTGESGQPASQVLNLGGTAQVTGNLVLDAAVGIGLNAGADDLRFLTGASVRF